ncbi:MAG: non-homologous end-joining DNA ligase [Blastocatellia bacterium]|nr:non-homologous end-joining DNA ligase [Blastocatellia bacterium]
MGLETYRRKRDFKKTPEPEGRVTRREKRRFVVQEHHASRLHFDFRLEMGGALKSWSVQKGPTLDPRVKRLAVMTEDHPVEYLKFEGLIPEGQYGAGEQLIWDAGDYQPKNGEDPLRQLKEGKLSFELRGDKLRGGFNLIRMKGRDDQWLLIKSDDEFAQPDWTLELRTGELVEETARPRKKKRKGRAHHPAPKTRAKTKRESRPMAASRVFMAKELSGDVDLKVGNEVVALTSLDKVYWPEDGYTKGDLVRYYYEIAKYILPYLKDRPLILKRYPNGINKPSFHQHDVDDAPDYARTIALDVEVGHTVDYLICDNLATLLYVTNLGAIERHPWNSRARNLDHPDWAVFDLDPGEGVEFAAICEVAMILKEIVGRAGLECFAKTSGSRGIHVYAPLKPVHGYEEVADFAERVASIVASERPDLATVERSLRKRPPSSVYVDHFQNARGKSVVAPYSARPRTGAPVSAPLDWAEVRRGKITPQDFTIENMRKRIERKGDLFKPALKLKQRLRADAL